MKRRIKKAHHVFLHIIIESDSLTCFSLEKKKVSSSHISTLLNLIDNTQKDEDGDETITSRNNNNNDDNVSAEWVFPPAQHKYGQTSGVKLLKRINRGKASSATVTIIK